MPNLVSIKLECIMRSEINLEIQEGMYFEPHKPQLEQHDIDK